MTNKPVCCVCIAYVARWMKPDGGDDDDAGDGDGWASILHTHKHCNHPIALNFIVHPNEKPWNVEYTLIIALFICCEKCFKWNFIHTKETRHWELRLNTRRYRKKKRTHTESKPKSNWNSVEEMRFQSLPKSIDVQNDRNSNHLF